MSRQVTEGLQAVGLAESVVFDITLPHTPATLASVEVEAEPTTPGGNWTDVTSSAMPTGSASNAAAVVTLPALVGSALTENQLYRVTLNYTFSGNTLESFFRVIAVK